MPNQVYHGGQQPEDDFQKDLHRERREKHEQFASDLKGINFVNQGLSQEEMRHIPVLTEGSPLLQGATYYDLRHPGRGAFVAQASMHATDDNYYVPKSEVDYLLWNRLIGVTDPDRLDLADNQNQ